jgi:hypothetical protein
VWSPKGDRIAFQSDREGDLAIFSQRVDGDGQAERLTKPEKGIEHAPESWGPIGDTVLFRASRSGDESSFSLWMLSVDDKDDKKDKKPAPFGGVESAIPTFAAFSRDGRWVAYDQSEPGKNSEVYVQPFPATGAKYQLPLSRDNHHPVWSSDGKELFYIPGPGDFASIAVSTAPAFAFGSPMPVKQVLQNDAPASPRQYDVMPDGRLLGKLSADQSTTGTPITSQINFVLNWFEELKQRVPVK